MCRYGFAESVGMQFTINITEGLGVNWSESYKPVRMATWDDIADSIRQCITMDDVVGMYAPDPPPKNHRIPCPIHNGQDYNLSYTSNHFRCFVCNEGGDVIAFVRSVCGLKDRKEAMMKINDDFHLGLPINSRVSAAESKVLEERRRKAKAREEEEKRLRVMYHSAMDQFIFLDILKRDFAPDTMQYAFAVKRIDGAWYEVECAINALHRFYNEQRVISN